MATKTKKKEVFAPVSELDSDTIDITPVNYDWSSGYAEEWEFTDAERCDKCGEPVAHGCDRNTQTPVGRRRGIAAARVGDDEHGNIDIDVECDGNVAGSDGPMMSYYYPLPGRTLDSREAAKKLVNLPLCVVDFIGGEKEGEQGLALTGGGMDLSWEICEAFMLLGFLPPLHFCDLPGRMAGRGESAKDRWIISGCKESARVSAAHANRIFEKLSGYFTRKLKTMK